MRNKKKQNQNLVIKLKLKLCVKDKKQEYFWKNIYHEITFSKYSKWNLIKDGVYQIKLFCLYKNQKSPNSILKIKSVFVKILHGYNHWRNAQDIRLKIFWHNVQNIR